MTGEEFKSHLAGADNAGDAFKFVRSMVVPPTVLGKPSAEDKGDPAIKLRQFYHVNWG